MRYAVPKFSPAPVNSPTINKDQSLMLWFRELGNLLGNMTSISNNKDTTNTQSINYVNSGAITTVSYKGTGKIVLALPAEVKFDAFLQVSNGTIITLLAGSKAITIPDYGATSNIVQGSYINAS